MNQFLNTPESCFYHITTFSNWQKIATEGLFAKNRKGISVIRTMDFEIINSVISLQLGAPEIVEENDFVLIKIPTVLNLFNIEEIEPDLVYEWTWPFHNNIKRSHIPARNLESVTRFSIFKWDFIANDDFKYENIYKNEGLFDTSFALVYTKNGQKYELTIDGELNYI